VQAALTSNGFSTALSGTFDAATAASLSSFQSDRGAANTGGHTVDTQTWHLLASGCNSSSATSAWWVDAGWPQGNMTVDMLRCLSDGGVRYAVFECWREYTGFWEPCVDNVANAYVVLALALWAGVHTRVCGARGVGAASSVVVRASCRVVAARASCGARRQ
jgi:hypothetical protein